MSKTQDMLSCCKLIIMNFTVLLDIDSSTGRLVVFLVILECWTAAYFEHRLPLPQYLFFFFKEPWYTHVG